MQTPACGACSLSVSRVRSAWREGGGLGGGGFDQMKEGHPHRSGGRVACRTTGRTGSSRWGAFPFDENLRWQRVVGDDGDGCSPPPPPWDCCTATEVRRRATEATAEGDLVWTTFDHFRPLGNKSLVTPPHTHLRVQHIPVINVMGPMTLFETNVFLPQLLAPQKQIRRRRRPNPPFAITGLW